MVTVLRPLSISELLDRTFHLYRNNFLVFVGIVAMPQLFILLVMLAGAGMMARSDPTTSIFMTLGGYFLYYVVIFLCQAPIIAAVSNLHLEKPVSIGAAYSSSKGSLPRVTWIVFLIFLSMVGLFAVVGMAIGAVVGLLAATSGRLVATVVGFAIALPAVFVAVRWMLNWSLVIPATVLEGGWFRTSIRRSKALAAGNRGRIFLIYFLMGVLGGIVSFMVQMLLLMLLPLFGIRDLPKIQAATQALQAIGIFVSTCLVGALGTIALSLVYYDQRVRKEGFDLQLMMATLEPGSQAPQAAASAT